MFTKSFFSNDFYFSLMLGLMDFSDTAIFCSRSNSCCQQNPKCLDNVSVNSKPDHPPSGQTPGNCFERAKFPTSQAQRKCETPTPGAEKSC